jgi:hypothetical protein
MPPVRVHENACPSPFERSDAPTTWPLALNPYGTLRRPPRIDCAKMPPALERLAKELLEQEATGDRARVETWFAKYGQMPPALRDALAAARDVPIDVDPIFSFGSGEVAPALFSAFFAKRSAWRPGFAAAFSHAGNVDRADPCAGPPDDS